MRASSAVLMLLLAACAAAPPAPVEYLLRPPFADTAASALQPARITLGRLQVAPYLDQAGIVVAGPDHRIEAARDHLWAEPLSESLRRMLQAGISRAAGEPVADARTDPGTHRGAIVDVNIHRLHGSLDGKVVLEAEWRVRNAATGEVVGRYRLARSTLTEQAGYDGLVQAHVTLLGALSDAIARTLASRQSGR